MPTERKGEAGGADVFVQPRWKLPSSSERRMGEKKERKRREMEGKFHAPKGKLKRSSLFSDTSGSGKGGRGGGQGKLTRGKGENPFRKPSLIPKCSTGKKGGGERVFLTVFSLSRRRKKKELKKERKKKGKTSNPPLRTLF